MWCAGQVDRPTLAVLAKRVSLALACGWAVSQSGGALSLMQPARRSPPEFAETLTAEWMPLCAQNKDGHGDGTGEIPEAALAIVSESWTHECRGQRVCPPRG